MNFSKIFLIIALTGFMVVMFFIAGAGVMAILGGVSSMTAIGIGIFFITLVLLIFSSIFNSLSKRM